MTSRAFHRRLAAGALSVTMACVLGACDPSSPGGADGKTGSEGPPALGVEDTSTVVTDSDGDLWPNCWSDDDALYAANGDGAGFGLRSADVVVNRITGSPDDGDLEGEQLSVGDDVGQVWNEGATRKPTGMLCTGGSMYLAVQDLQEGFNAAPSATIARSDDHGRSWTWDTEKPMFDDGVFTTLWFVDYGKEGADSPDPDRAYVFGLDGNWRDSYDDSAPDPTDLFLARVPTDSVQDLSTWEFYSGRAGGTPRWDADIEAKQPVLSDDRTVHGKTVLSQGGVTYLPEKDSYVYTSWTEQSFEFYRAPEPWGPWERMGSTDFGEYPWTEDRYGGYGLTIPSKFLGEGDTSGWLQSNVCPCAPAGMSSYQFGLRKVDLT
jgi:hypothetical protein